MKPIIITFYCLVFSLKIVSQNENNNFFDPITKDHKYIHYLLVPDSSTRSSLLHFSYQYMYIPKSNTFYTGGMHFNIGLNFSRFFTDKFILGVCFDLKSFKGFVKQKFSTSFVSDFNSNFVAEYKNSQDSAVAYTLKETINGTNGFGVDGNNFDGYGLSFSPFPDRFGGMMLQVKKNQFSFPFFGQYTSKAHLNDEGKYLSLNLNNCYSFEISINPYKLTSKKFTKLSQIRATYKFVILTFYYQRLNFTNATFDNKPINEIMRPEFLEKYKTVQNYGFKIGLGFW